MTTLDDTPVVACGTPIGTEPAPARAIDGHRRAAGVRWPSTLVSRANDPAADFWAVLRRMLEGSAGR